VKDLSGILNALRRVRSFFPESQTDGARRHLDELIRLGESSEPLDQLQMQSGVKDNRFLWLVMGTIADRSFKDPIKDREFRDAYLAVARECEDAGLGSNFSKDVLELFGTWKQKGI
jgi:hypothetical protein